MDYEIGFKRLKAFLQAQKPQALSELATLEARLLEIREQERKFGGTETTRAGLAQVVYSLNDLALRTCKVSFNDLCVDEDQSPLAGNPAGLHSGSNITSGDIYHITITGSENIAIGKGAQAVTGQNMPSTGAGDAAATVGKGWSTAVVRRLLQDALSDQELTDLCFDHYKDVYNNFSAGMGKSQKIQALLEYCMRRDRVEELVELVRQANPSGYTKVMKA